MNMAQRMAKIDRNAAASRAAEPAEAIAQIDAAQRMGALAPRDAFGAHGIRYDEECNHCGREGEVDNDSSLCRRCH